ncbi:MAG: helix-turn-helix transcriptional regulator [Lachnospiraceae bacterium]|nr:helix-turn-helix transcriptional regulator [Lachnospiraceae bacterium]
MGKERTAESRGEEYVAFGRNLATARVSLGLSQADIAARLDMPQSTYAGYESGTRKVPLSVILQFSNFFGKTPDELIGIKEMVISSPKSVQSTFTDEEYKLLKYFNDLNKDGKKKLIERASELLELGYIEKGKAEKMA